MEMKQTVNELTEKEMDWLAAQQKVARSFVNCFSPEDSGKPLTLAALDRAYTAWIASRPDDPDIINGIINGTGAAFGQFLVDLGDLRWIIAIDEHGSDLAVFGLPDKGDVLVYPINFVAKRWEGRETEFFEKSCAEIAATVRLLATGRTFPSKPWWRFW
jgi:hypothetical protein